MKKRPLFWRMFSSFLSVGVLGLASYFFIVVYYLSNTPLELLKDKTELYFVISRNFGISLVLLMLVMAIVSYWLSRKIALPLEILKKKTQEVMDSGSSQSLVYYDSQTKETAELASLIGELHSHLINRVKKVTTQKNEQEAIFMSLSEGVIALSSDLKIKRMNTTAKKYFSLEERFKKDLPFADAIREPELSQFVKDAMGVKEPAEMELEMLSPIERVLKVTSAPYMNAGSDEVGVILVFTDITRLKKLEKHRIEFVANVSHELRTPLTSIQGYSETLLNPKVQEIPEKQIEFAQKIKDNSIRLKNMVEDLLYLANLDQNEDSGGEFDLKEEDLNFQVRRAIEFLKAKSLSENMKISFEAKAERKVKINDGLFSQAVINIIDNAIKYSGDSDTVFLKTYTDEEGAACLEVRDQGIGISEEDIGRLFERFYRVDKDRSRITGGSGLGLAIVKNILDLHQIELVVSSDLGKGTCFTLKFPT